MNEPEDIEALGHALLDCIQPYRQLLTADETVYHMVLTATVLALKSAPYHVDGLGTIQQAICDAHRLIEEAEEKKNAEVKDDQG